MVRHWPAWPPLPPRRPPWTSLRHRDRPVKGRLSTLEGIMRHRLGLTLVAIAGLVAGCQDAQTPVAPALSPQFSQAAGDGLHGAIAFHRGATFDGDFEVYVMNADGSDVTQVTHNDVNEFDPIWSPNGKQLTFGRCQATCDAVVINDDGSGERVLVNDGFPRAWSPDGQRILFSRCQATCDIIVINVDGSGERVLITD